MVSLRMDEDLLAEIDRVAAAQGQSRSAWMVNILTRAVLDPENGSLPVPAAGKGGHPDEQIRVTVRLNRSEIEAIEKAAGPMGLSRNQWIKRALRWQLWDKAARLRLCPNAQDEIGKVRKQALSLHRNINQAVKAMNASLMPESSLDLARIAGPFIEACGEVKALLWTTRRAMSSYVGGEVGYWTGAFGEPRQ